MFNLLFLKPMPLEMKPWNAIGGKFLFTFSATQVSNQSKNSTNHSCTNLVLPKNSGSSWGRQNPPTKLQKYSSTLGYRISYRDYNMRPHILPIKRSPPKTPTLVYWHTPKFLQSLRKGGGYFFTEFFFLVER
jgi:hypothetical protein